MMFQWLFCAVNEDFAAIPRQQGQGCAALLAALEEGKAPESLGELRPMLSAMPQKGSARGDSEAGSLLVLAAFGVAGCFR